MQLTIMYQTCHRILTILVIFSHLVLGMDHQWIQECIELECQCSMHHEHPLQKLVSTPVILEMDCPISKILESPTGSDFGTKKSILNLRNLPTEVNILKITSMENDLVNWKNEPDSTWSYGYSRRGESETEFSPSTSDAYQHIKVLNLRNLGIQALDNSTINFISVFTNIQSIDLDNNRIEVIRRHTFLKTPNLKLIILSSNEISTLPETTFKHLTQLQYLTLARNKLRTLPENLPLSLSLIDLSDNYIGRFTSTFNFPNLKFLNLCGNRIAESDFFKITDVRNLRNICIGDSGAGLPTNLNIKAPYLANISLSSAHSEGALLDLRTVAELDSFHSLRELALSYYSLNTLSFLKNKTQLVTLKLERIFWNKTAGAENATTLAECIEGKHSLNRVILDHSPDIVKMLLETRALATLTNLTYLSLQFNGLKTLDPSCLPNLQRLQINICYNPLICDSRLKWIMSIREKKPNFLHDEEMVYCATPFQNSFVEAISAWQEEAKNPESTTEEAASHFTLRAVGSTASLATSSSIRFVASTAITSEKQEHNHIMRIYIMNFCISFLTAGATAVLVLYLFERRNKCRFNLKHGYNQDMISIVE